MMPRHRGIPNRRRAGLDPLVAQERSRYAERMAGVVDRAVQELYALPLQEFTRARNARAAALKAAGQSAEARAVRQLRRPPVTLWVTNQLARAAPERLAALVKSVGELRRTQLRDRDAAGEALRRQRAELDGLVASADAILVEHGHRATPAMQRRISDTLLGAAVDRRRADELRAGRLTEELAAPGFEVFADAPKAPRLRLVRGGKSEADSRRARTDGQAAMQAAREQRALEAQTQRRRAEELTEAAEQAQREVQELTARMAESRRRLRDAQRAAGKASTAARRADRKTRR